MKVSTQTTPTAAVNLSPGDLLTEVEAADILKARVQTLRNWRSRGAGPRYRKVGDRMVRYLRSDLSEFVENGAA